MCVYIYIYIYVYVYIYIYIYIYRHLFPSQCVEGEQRTLFSKHTAYNIMLYYSIV